jgi:hypothetical protein
MKKLHNKDFTIAVKTGDTNGVVKFRKEAVTGEMYFDTQAKDMYLAFTTAGAEDAKLAKFTPTNIES